jgi:hypothetical protein
MGKTNTLGHMYHSLNYDGIGTLSRICTGIILRQPKVSHHDFDHSMEDHCFSP